MPRKRTDDKHLELFESLQRWATENQHLGNPYVEGMLAALQNRENLAYWASLNPNDFLPFSRSHSSLRRLSNTLALIRNILIFIPVALTWTAVGEATTAFQTYNETNSNSVSNFLDFWQNGYGVLNEFWKIGHIATLDAIIISVLIGLILIIHFLNQKIAIDERRSKQVLDNRRLSLAVHLGEYLFSKRSISDLTLKDALANATGDLLQSSTNINKSSAALVKLTRESSITKILSTLKASNQESLKSHSEVDRRSKA